MNDLISRQAAIDALKRKQDDGKGDLSRFYNTIIQHDIEAIMQLPPIQPKRGRWEMRIDERFVECSECGLMTTRNELKGIAVFGKNEPNFCPNCGAKMEVTT